MLQEDASEDGASTQQQGQHADDGHQHIKELLRVILGWQKGTEIKGIKGN